MIEKINQHLENIGSNFRTDDGITLVAYIGHMTFLRRTFRSVEECFNYVMNCKAK